jgi:hypothetical protein
MLDRRLNSIVDIPLRIADFGMRIENGRCTADSAIANPQSITCRRRAGHAHTKVQAQVAELLLHFGQRGFAEVADVQQLILALVTRSRTVMMFSDSRQLLARTERFKSASGMLSFDSS